MINRKQMREILDAMEEMFPHAYCELKHSNPFELLVAVVLSAQCTDETVNKVTKDLFQKYHKPEDYLSVPLDELENDIRRIGLWRNKAKNIQGLSAKLLQEHGGQVPTDRETLMKLPGVGRKTANVVISNAFHTPAIAVDTHVERVAKRLGICGPDATPLEVEQALMDLVPEEEWTRTHHLMIFFGRYHCKAKNPNCHVCPLLHLCEEGKKRMQSYVVQSGKPGMNG